MKRSAEFWFCFTSSSFNSYASSSYYASSQQLSIFLSLLWIRGTIAMEEKQMPQDLSKGPSSERNTGQSNQNLSFRCSDVGQANCNWQASGKSEDELLPKIEQHAREVHHMNMDENTRSKVRW